MIGVSILSRAKPGELETLHAAWTHAAAETLAHDPGCRVYHILRSSQDPDLLSVFAVYESKEALDAHNASPRSKALLPPILASSEGKPVVHTGPVTILQSDRHGAIGPA